MKKIVALCAAALLVAFVAPGLRADNSVLGKGKARDLQKQVEGQGSAGVTTPKTNAPAPKAPANSTPAKK
jgi:hypothetical protein